MTTTNGGDGGNMLCAWTRMSSSFPPSKGSDSFERTDKWRTATDGLVDQSVSRASSPRNRTRGCRSRCPLFCSRLALKWTHTFGRVVAGTKEHCRTVVCAAVGRFPTRLGRRAAPPLPLHRGSIHSFISPALPSDAPKWQRDVRLSVGHFGFTIQFSVRDDTPVTLVTLLASDHQSIKR
uniref:Uncharacterized protein n=1 Tax=Plectus sambesii TaxID=2011161 RepID=A0A914VNJ8_9BILA